MQFWTSTKILPNVRVSKKESDRYLRKYMIVSVTTATTTMFSNMLSGLTWFFSEEVMFED